MKECKVYSVPECGLKYLFSEGVTRVFGQNRVIHMLDNTHEFACVMPLECNPHEQGLELIGFIKNE